MPKNIGPYIVSNIPGILGMIFTFFIWNSFAREEVVRIISVICLLYFILGLLIGLSGTFVFWIGWLLLHVPSLFSFIPGVVQGFLMDNPGLGFILYFMLDLVFIPVPFSLAGIYTGKKLRSRIISHTYSA